MTGFGTYLHGVIVVVTMTIRDLTKMIKGKEIIHGLTFDVKAGEVFGLLGPNGAGKTTTIRMLVGLIRPTTGRIKICGHDLKTDFVQAIRCIGSIVETPKSYAQLSGRQNLELLARMHRQVSQAHLEEVIARVKLGERIDDPVKTYSLGMRQRLGIAQALLGQPQVLILDEPTNGLDPLGMRELRSFLRSLAKEHQLSIIVSSHILSEIEKLCDRVAILHRGRLIYMGPISDLSERNCGWVEWDLQPADKGLAVLKTSPDVTRIETCDQHTIRVQMSFDRIAALNRTLHEAGIEVRGIDRRIHALEDVFMKLTGEH